MLPAKACTYGFLQAVPLKGIIWLHKHLYIFNKCPHNGWFLIKVPNKG